MVRADNSIMPALPAARIRATGCCIGRFRFHRSVGGCIQVLPTWVIANCTNPAAHRIAELLGGQVHPDDDAGNDPATRLVVTHCGTVDVLLEGPPAIQLQMVRRVDTTLLRFCDGRIQTTPRDTRPCQCPPALPERRQAAKAGHGCEPLVQVVFRLAELPALGRFELVSATWAFAEHATAIKAELRGHRRPIPARLGLDRALHTTANGTIFAYTRPTITILPDRL